MSIDEASEPRFRYEDYQQWSGDERWELLAGEPFLMSPAPSRRHQESVVALLAQIAPAVRGGPFAVSGGRLGAGLRRVALVRAPGPHLV